MTEKQARELAKRERYYSAQKIRGQWVVWDAQADHQVEFDNYIETTQRLENDLLAKNLKRIDRLSRRGLMLFLDKEISKANTHKLRNQARLIAIRGNGVEVDMDLARAALSR